jgi:AraC-like DNA-binding protein
MMSCPSITFEEFDAFTTVSSSHDGMAITIREHPDFGTWEEKSIDLGFIKLAEHKTDLIREVSVAIKDKQLVSRMNHCMCVDGSLGAHFHDNQLKADLGPGMYHYISVQADEYSLAMSKKFHNIHMDICRDYYAGLLSDNEEWSSRLKVKLMTNALCYPGEFTLTPAMSNTVFDIFCSPLNGSLRQLLIEAKGLELIALQLNSARVDDGRRRRLDGKRDLMFGIREYLERTFLEPHSLRSICLQFGINEFALKQGFKNTFQTTVFDFLLSRRLEHARHLLSNTSASIREVSSTVGYKYSNHFSAAFKQKFGVSPAKLLQQ